MLVAAVVAGYTVADYRVADIDIARPAGTVVAARSYSHADCIGLPFLS